MWGQLGWVSLVFFGVAQTLRPPTLAVAFSAGKVCKTLGLFSYDIPRFNEAVSTYSVSWDAWFQVTNTQLKMA